MSVNLNRLQHDYVANIPQELPVKATQGFVVTAAINLFSGFTAKYALVGGAVAALSTVIESLTRPIIKGIFPDHPTIATVIQITMPKMAALAFAASVAPWVGVSYKMTSLLLPLIAWIALNENFYQKNVAMVEVL